MRDGESVRVSVGTRGGDDTGYTALLILTDREARLRLQTVRYGVNVGEPQAALVTDLAEAIPAHPRRTQPRWAGLLQETPSNSDKQVLTALHGFRSDCDSSGCVNQR